MLSFEYYHFFFYSMYLRYAAGLEIPWWIYSSGIMIIVLFRYKQEYKKNFFSSQKFALKHFRLSLGVCSANIFDEDENLEQNMISILNAFHILLPWFLIGAFSIHTDLYFEGKPGCKYARKTQTAISGSNGILLKS